MAKGDKYDESRLTTINGKVAALRQKISEIDSDINNCIVGTTGGNTIESKLKIKSTSFYTNSLSESNAGGTGAYDRSYTSTKDSLSYNSKNW